MKLNKLYFALLFATGFVHAEQCVQQRYQVSASDLAVGDVVELNIGNESVSFTTNANNNLADQWPQQLGLRVRNNLNSDVASVGDMSDLNNLNRYIPRLGSDSNYLDVFSDDAVSLKINGLEVGTVLVEQQLPAVSEKSIDLPAWVTGSGNNSYLILTNLSDQPMPIQIELFNENGGVFDTSGSWSAGFTSNPTQTGAAIKANSTAWLHIASSSFVFAGTGKITWTPNSCNPELMVAQNQTLSQQTDIFRLNGGAPL